MVPEAEEAKEKGNREYGQGHYRYAGVQHMYMVSRKALEK